MEKTKEEMMEYAIKMRVRGDDYRSILNYLQLYSSDKNLIDEIISEIDQLEKNKIITSTLENTTEPQTVNLLLGSLFSLSGIVLIFFLWGKGFISTIPFLIIGMGVWVLTSGSNNKNNAIIGSATWCLMYFVDTFMLKIRNIAKPKNNINNLKQA